MKATTVIIVCIFLVGLVSGTFWKKKFQNNKDEVIVHQSIPPSNNHNYNPLPPQYRRICAQDALQVNNCLKFQSLSEMQNYNEKYKTGYYQVADYICDYPGIPYGQCFKYTIPWQPIPPLQPPGHPWTPAQPQLCVAKTCEYNPMCARSKVICRRFAHSCGMEHFNCVHKTDFARADNYCPNSELDADAYCMTAPNGK